MTRFCVEEGLEARLDPSATQKLGGLFLFRKFRLNGRPKTVVPIGLAHLMRTGGGSRLGLVGGLPLHFQRHTYLSGGEPMLAIPDDVRVSKFDMRKVSNDTVIELKVQDGGEYPIFELNLEDGAYEIDCGDASVRIDVMESVVEHAGVGIGSVTLPGINGAEVDGTFVRNRSVTRAAPLRLPLAEENSSLLLLGASPDEHAMVAPPLWLTNIAGFLSWTELDAWIDFEPVWRIETSKGNWIAYPMAELLPTIDGALDTAHLWAQCFRKSDLVAGCSDDQRSLWDLYLEVCGASL